MSTYESEHDVQETQSNAQPQLQRQQRDQPTLTQAIASFLDNSSGLGSQSDALMISALRDTLQNSDIDEDQQNEFLQAVTSNNMMVDLLSAIGSAAGSETNAPNKGIDDSFMDKLDRVSIKDIKKDETCPICTNDYHSDPHPLIVRLPCNKKHFFDLDCIGPWLKLNRTCPLCRVDVTKPRKLEILEDDEEIEEDWEMYG